MYIEDMILRPDLIGTTATVTATIDLNCDSSGSVRLEFTTSPGSSLKIVETGTNELSLPPRKVQAGSNLLIETLKLRRDPDDPRTGAYITLTANKVQQDEDDNEDYITRFVTYKKGNKT